MRLKLGVYYNQFVPKYTKFVRSELKNAVPTKSVTACPALVGILSCELWVG